VSAITSKWAAAGDYLSAAANPSNPHPRDPVEAASPQLFTNENNVRGGLFEAEHQASCQSVGRTTRPQRLGKKIRID
jgi:hypothetical protein